jgi:predicted small lipoprotein YifL
MKNIFSIILIITFISLVLASCGSKKAAGCDAYSSLQQKENSDLATK